MGKTSQWLSARDKFSDWITNRKNFTGGEVSLENQNSGLTDHPLPMEGIFVLGLDVLGGNFVKRSQFNSDSYTRPAQIPRPVPFVCCVMSQVEAM